MSSEGLGAILKRTFNRVVRPQKYKATDRDSMLVNNEGSGARNREMDNRNNTSLNNGHKRSSLQSRFATARALALQRSETLTSRLTTKSANVFEKCGGSEPISPSSKRPKNSANIQSRLSKARKKSLDDSDVSDRKSVKRLQIETDVSDTSVIPAKRLKKEGLGNTLTESFLVVSEAGSDHELSLSTSQSIFNISSSSVDTVISVNSVINNDSPNIASDKGESKKKTLASRFAKARHKLFAKRRTGHLNTHSNELAEVPKIGASPTISVEKVSKSLQVEQWLGDNDPYHNPNESINDSLTVNVDDTLENKSILYQDNSEMEWDNVSHCSENKSELESSTKHMKTCVVVDTNIFIHNLSKLQELLRLKCAETIIIYVPWMVLQELDNLKERSNLKSNALAAQRFINKEMSQSDARIVGQSIDDLYDQVHLGQCPDDKILSCALQVQRKYQTVIVLTGDINLRNKVMSNNMKAYKPDEIISQLKFNKYIKAKVKLQMFLSQVIVHCCKNAFGESVHRMGILKGSPWHFEDCLKRFKKHWGTVFQTCLLKQSRTTVDALIRITSNGDIGDDDTSALNQFKDKMSELLYYIQDMPEFNSQARKIRTELCNLLN